MTLRRLSRLPIPWIFASLGCGLNAPPGETGFGVDSTPIINGTVDSSHEAVVFVRGKDNTACSGTIVYKTGANAFVLTAAHCGDPEYVLQGKNIENPAAYYPAQKFARHSKWSGTPPAYDFMMVQISGATAATPVIPPMSPADDKLAASTQIRHVGYGKAGPAPGTATSERHQILGKLASVQALTLSYNQPNGGPCSGDSGGPQLTTTATEIVAGVTSAGDANCKEAGTSGRVSAVHDTFIMPFITNAPAAQQTCDQCTQGATTGQNADCFGKVQACSNDVSCNALMACLQGCNGDSKCANDCAFVNQAGIGAYNAIFDCVCDTGCVGECKDDPMCQQPSSSSAATSATSGAGTASTATSAASGAGGADATSGAGGSSSATGGLPANGEAWIAGDLQVKEHEGTLVGSCGLSPGAPRGASPWLALVALVLLWGGRRSSPAV